MIPEKKITIKDIAKLAGVSPGTVDRVIHNRGKVSADKKARINEVLDRLDYQPNVIAKTLKNNKRKLIAVLMPDPEVDEYWFRAQKGIDKAIKEFGAFNLAVDKFFFDPKDPQSFVSFTDEIRNKPYDGVLVVPMFSTEAENLLFDCASKKIPVVSFNTRHKGDISYFIGQDLRQSGRLAGNLISLSQTFQGNILMVHIDETPNNTRHVREKENGIKSHFHDIAYPAHQLHSLQYFHTESSITESLLSSAYLNEDVSAVFISTSKAYEIASVIKAKAPRAVVVGYDLIGKNVELLKKGVITYLIDQNPMQQAYLGISRFLDLLVFQREVEMEELLPLNIAIKENVDSIVFNRLSS